MYFFKVVDSGGLGERERVSLPYSEFVVFTITDFSTYREHVKVHPQNYVNMVPEMKNKIGFIV